MNIYVVIEGEGGAKAVYKHWIVYRNSSLTSVGTIEQVKNNNFIVIAGFGYPFYFRVVDDAIADVNSHIAFDRLVIAVDAEDFGYKEKYDEILGHLNHMSCRVPIYIVVQHFCLETWALGNKQIIRKKPVSERLKGYKNLYDVRVLDPEHLPENADEKLNRSQFSDRYLRAALNDRYRNLTYRKNNPKPLLHPTYFRELKSRFEDTGHIPSFGDFLNAFG